MERVRPPRPSEDSSLETIGPLPSTASLARLVEVVRSPGVLRADVDELLRGLARPLAQDESPRARADLLLSLIESAYMSDMLGSDGRTVRAAAVQALLELGYPYALEIPPEALDDLPVTKAKPGKQEIPLPGLLATAVGLLVQGGYTFPSVFELLTADRGNGALAGLIMLGALLGPALSAVFGGWKRVRWLQRLGLFTMTLTGSLWLVGFSTMLLNHPWPLAQPETWFALIAGLGFLLGAALMRQPEWLAKDQGQSKDKALDKDATPPPPP